MKFKNCQIFFNLAINRNPINQTRNHYFQHLKNELVEYLKSQNKNDQFIQESCAWLEFQIKHFYGVISGYRTVPSLTLLDDFEFYFRES